MRTRATKPVVVVAALIAATSCSSSPEAGDQGGAASGYPERRITVVVPAPAGGPLDVAARAVQPCMEDELGQRMIVENRTGGTGSIGVTHMLSAEPDGYTLGTISQGSAMLPPLTEEGVSFTAEDYTTIGVIMEIPSLFSVRADSPLQTGEDLIAAFESGDVSVGSPGANTTLHIGAQQLIEKHGLEFRLAPLQGAPALRTALLGGNVDVSVEAANGEVLELIESGEIRALATGSPEPVPFVEDATPLADLGYGDLPDMTTHFGLGAPAGLPDDVTATLADALEGCLQDEEVLTALDERLVPDEFIGPEDFREIVDRVTEQYGEIL